MPHPPFPVSPYSLIPETATHSGLPLSRGYLYPLLTARGLTHILSPPPQQAQVPQPEVAPRKPTPPPPPRKKSQEKKSSLKRALSLKRLAPEEPKRVGAATALGPETRPKRPSFLPLCISSQRPSTSSIHGERALAVAIATAASLRLWDLPRAGIGQPCSDAHTRPPAVWRGVEMEKG